jgi:hypothetical protein
VRNSTVPFTADSIGEQLRRRRAASYRVPPLDHSGLRDPLETPCRQREPSSFGLSEIELRAEIARCQRAGWTAEEIRVRFVNPRMIGAVA